MLSTTKSTETIAFCGYRRYLTVFQDWSNRSLYNLSVIMSVRFRGYRFQCCCLRNQKHISYIKKDAKYNSYSKRNYYKFFNVSTLFLFKIINLIF